MSRFDAYDLALQAALALRPLLDPINRRDLTCAARYGELPVRWPWCLDEGSSASGRIDFTCTRVAAGSACRGAHCLGPGHNLGLHRPAPGGPCLGAARPRRRHPVAPDPPEMLNPILTGPSPSPPPPPSTSPFPPRPPSPEGGRRCGDG